MNISYWMRCLLTVFYTSSAQVTTSHGEVEIFGTNSTNVPSRDEHEINTTASVLAPASFMSDDPRPLTFSVESKDQGGLLCSGNFTIRVEDNAVKRTGQCILQLHNLSISLA